MNIAKFCIRHKVTTLLAVIMIAVFGVVYTTQLQMALLPNIEYPAAYVYCYYNGAGPEDIEQLVTRPLPFVHVFHAGQDHGLHKALDKGGLAAAHQTHHPDVDVSAGACADLAADALLLLFVQTCSPLPVCAVHRTLCRSARCIV